MTTAARRIRTTAVVFELPQKLGILQYVEYEPPPREWCTGDGCLYEGVLTAEGCRKGVCVRYRVWVFSRDRRRWEAKERWRRQDEEAGGCIKQQVADVLLELSERGDWVKKWVILRERLVEIAKVLRRFPWMVDVVRQRPMSILHPYMVEAYVTRDGSEVCLSLNPPKAFCTQNGAV